MKCQVVRVRWKDAYVTQDERDQDGITTMLPHAEGITVGYLVRKSRDAVYVAQDWFPSGSAGLEGDREIWRGITVIPRGMIIEVKTLTRG